MSIMQRLLSFIRGFPRVVWLLGLGSVINVGGLSLLWPVNSIYIHTVLGKPLTVAGLVLMVYSSLGFVGSFVGGWCYDRFGAIPVLAVSISVSALTILIPVFAHGWWVYVGVMAVFGCTCAMPFPVLSAFVGHAWPAGGRRAYNFIYVANNLGVAIGTAVGGVAAQSAFWLVFAGIAFSYAIFFVLVLTVFRTNFASIRRETPGASAVDPTKPGVVLAPVPWAPISLLLIGFGACWTIYVQWQSTISVYIQSLGYPLTYYSVLWTLNGILIFALQPVISAVVRRLHSLVAQMLSGVFLYVIAFALLLSAHQYYVFVIAMVVTTLGEMLAWPAVPAAILQLAPANRLGALQGLGNSAATFGRMLGPLIGGVLYDASSIRLVLFVCLCGAILPIVCFVGFHQLVKREPAPGHAGV